MNNVVVHDVCEVIAIDEINDKTYFIGLTSTNNVNQTVDSTPIRGGIGNKRVTTINNSKDINFEVTTTLHNDDIYALQSGGLFSDEAINVLRSETKQAVDNAGSVEVTIDGTPVGEVTVLDKNGKELTGSFTAGKVTITGGQAGQFYTVIYEEAQPTASVLDLNAEEFPKPHKVQLHTICYDPDTEKVVADLYWIFDKARPDGNLTAAYSAGENQQDTINFICETPIGSTSYGKYVVVPRTTP